MRRLMIGLLAALGIVGCGGGGAGPAAPAAPSALSVTPKGSSLMVLSWQDLSDNEDGFRIERREDGAEFMTIGEVAANATSYVAAEMQPSTTYSFRVIAHNGAGVGTSEMADAATGALEWKKLALSGGPSQRQEHSAVYDGARNRMVVFGGTGLFPIVEKTPVPTQIWVLNLSGEPSWEPMTPGGVVESRYRHSAILDAPRDRMIVFGGTDMNGTMREEVLSLDLASGMWSELYPGKPKPMARMLHSAVYDAAKQRMIVFGGINEMENVTSDLWMLDLANGPHWIQVPQAGDWPDPRYHHSAVYDSQRQEMVVFGGRGAVGVALGDVWVLKLGDSPEWKRSTPSGSVSALFGHEAINDGPNGRMLVYGGGTGIDFSTDIYSLQLGETPAWSKLIATGIPPKRSMFGSAIRVEGKQELIIFGGGPVWKGESPEADADLFSIAH